jgi:hypothetical protein
MPRATAGKGGALPTPASTQPPVNAVARQTVPTKPGVQMFDIERRPGGATVSTFIPDTVLLTIYTGTNLRTNLGKMVETCEFREIGMAAGPRKPIGTQTATGKPAMSEAARKKIAAAQRKRHAEKKRAAAGVGTQSAGGGAS